MLDDYLFIFLQLYLTTMASAKGADSAVSLLLQRDL